MNRMKWMCLALVVALFGCGDINHTSTGPESPAAAEKSTSALLSSEDGNVALVLNDLRGVTIPATAVSVKVFVDSRLVEKFTGASNNIRLRVPFTAGDLDYSGVVDFDDFFIYADQFGLRESSDGFDFRCDFNGSGLVDFDDFFIFADDFGKAARFAAAAKPIVFSDSPPLEKRGKMTATDFATAYNALRQSVTRSAKIAAAGSEYLFKVSSLETAFAAKDTTVVGVIFEPREIVVQVNAAPRTSAHADSVFSVTVGDTVHVVMSQYFMTDDSLRYSVERTMLPWAVESDSVLLVTPISPDTTGITFRATDTADQSLAFRLSIGARLPVITRILSVSPSDTTVEAGADTSVPARGSLATFLDGQLSKTEEVQLALVGRDSVVADSLVVLNLRFSFEDLEAMQTISILPPPPPPVVVDQPPSVRLRLDRYQSALGSGRSMDFRVDANDDIGLDSTPARVVARHGQDSVVVEVRLMQIDLLNGYAYGAISIPAATSANPVTWTLTAYATDSAGQVGSASLEFPQDGWVAPPPPPPPPCDDTCHGYGTYTACGRYCGDAPPPPPTLVAPSFTGATLNVYSAGTPFSVTVGQTVTLAFSGVAGTPTPSAELMVNTGSGFQSAGGVTFTPSSPGVFQAKGRLTNSVGSVETTACNITVLGGGAP